MNEALKITKPQLISLMQIWNRVCKDRGWKSGDRAFRLAKMGELAGRQINSTSEIGRLDEFTKIKHGLNALLGVSLQSGMEAGDQTINQARTLRWVIQHELMACLALYHPDPEGYVRSIMQDKNRWWKIDRPAVEMTLLDLDARPIVKRDRITGQLREFGSQLEQLRSTVNARVHAMRNKAGDSIHTMRIRAGLPCNCSLCEKQAAAVVVPAPAALSTRPF